MATETITRADASRSEGKLRIEFLFLDLTTCTRCLGADRNLESALEVVREVLDAAAVDVEINKVLVQSEDQARMLRFVSSPTIRVNGVDVALELKESSCGSEACTDGCGDNIACRVWIYHGREYTEPPVAMIVDAILRQLYGGAALQVPAQPDPYELSESLGRFFAGKAGPGAPEVPVCCAPSEQETCCDAAAKDDCCGTSTAVGCGCR